MKRLTVNSSNSLRRDPTRTTTLRRAFTQDAVRRYEQLRRDLIELIVAEDAFGLQKTSLDPLVNAFCPTGEGGGVDPTCSPKNKPELIVTPVGPGTFDLQSRISSQGNVIEGQISGFPVTTSERQLIQKLSKKTIMQLEESLADPEIQYAMQVGRIREIAVHPTTSRIRDNPNPKGWTAAHSGNELIIHPKTGEAIEKSIVAERRDYGLKRIIHHEVGHAVWQVTSETIKEQFSRALDQSPELVAHVSRIVNVQARPNSFSKVGDRLTTEAFAEVTAIRRYDTKRYETLSEGIKASIEAAWRNSERFVQRPQLTANARWSFMSTVNVWSEKAREAARLARQRGGSLAAISSRIVSRHKNKKGMVKSKAIRDDVAKTVRQMGYHTLSSDSKSTNSVYLVIGRKTEHGGISTVAQLRISDHATGFKRTGVVDKTRHNLIGSRVREDQIERLLTSLPKLSGSGRGSEIQLQPTTNARWSFMSTIEKLNQFAQWLKQRLDFRILGNTVEQIENAWWYQYVMDGFRKGAGRSFDDVRKRPTSEEKLDFFQGRRREFLQGAFGRPESIDKVKLLAGRVLTDLKGVNDATATQLSRVLTDGLVQGKNPRAIASDITKVIDTISKRRATVIARTEIIRAHAEGQLLALEKLGVTQLGVQVEWSTTGDDRVCPLCQPLEGIVITLDEARGMLPRHPGCRCSWLPASVGEDDKQKDTQSQIKRAITKSILAERPKRTKGGIAKTKLQSKWVGADKRIAKNRPKSILKK